MTFFQFYKIDYKHFDSFIHWHVVCPFISEFEFIVKPSS